MDYKYISQLLERYWQCQTTLEEEAILKTFFSQAVLPEEFSQYRELFAYQQQAQTEGLGNEFDQRILNLVGCGEEVASPVVKARTISMSARLAPLFKAAAVVAIILTMGNALQVPFQDNGYYPPTAYEQPEQGASMAMTADSSNVLVEHLDTLSQAVIAE